ncbi:hypothetical protein TPAR_07601, partial [Tolypocladium paradoxum]
RPVADLELASPAAVVAAGAQPEVRAAATDVVGDAAVPLAVEDPAVAQVGASGDDEECAGRGPGLLEDGGLGDGDDGVVGGEQAAERVQALSDGLGTGADKDVEPLGSHGAAGCRMAC